jgi:hypothetical protein
MGIVRVSNSGILVVESGVVSAAGSFTPAVLPQQGNIQLRWDMSVATDIWQDSFKFDMIQDGETIFTLGVKGSGSVQSNTDYLQPAAVNRPTWRADGINGLGAIEFNGTTAYMQCNPNPNGITSGDQTVLCVFAPVGGQTGTNVLFNWGGGGPSWNPGLFIGTTDLLRPFMNGFNGVTASTAYTADETLGIIMTDDGSDAQTFRYSHDGTGDTRSEVTTETVEGSLFTLGSQSASASSLYEGLIGELMVWSPSLTVSEMDELQLWATEKWGMVWA